MARMLDAAWFRAVNDGSRYALAEGVARTSIGPDSLSAELYRPDGARYATIEGSVDEESGRIAATASLTSDAEAEVTLYGYFFQRDEADNPKLRREEDLSVLLTDGWTTFGIAVPARRD